MKHFFDEKTRQFQVYAEPWEIPKLKKLPKSCLSLDKIRGCYWIPESQWHILAGIDPSIKALYADRLIQVFSEPYYPTIREPLEHQKDAICFLLDTPRALLADDMGLGKTFDALAGYEILRQRGNVFNIIILSPKRVMKQWLQEFRDTLGREPFPGEVLQLNYEKTWRGKHNQDAFNAIGPRSLLVLDEVHNLSNPDTQQYQAVEAMAKPCKWVWGLTGTPVRNRPESFHGPYTLITGANLSRKQFLDSFAIHTNGRIIAHRNLSTLAGIFDRFGLRRPKSSVVTIPKTVIPVSVPMGTRQAKAYDRMAEEMITELKGIDDKTFQVRARGILAKLGRLLQISSHPGMLGDSIPDSEVAKLETLAEMLQEAGEQKVIIWSFHPWTLERIAARFPERNPVVLHGGSSDKKREKDIETFLKDPSCTMACLSVLAFGEGLNLQSASCVAVYYDLDWRFDKFIQSQDRIHRMGQNRAVSLYVLMSSGTLDEYVFGLLQQKKAWQNAITGGNEQDNIEAMSKKELIQAIRRKR